MTQKELVTLIVPIYNEEDHLEEFLKDVDSLRLEAEKELVIINDCSTDNSWNILTSFEFKTPVTLINKTVNEGKGAAIRSGIKSAKGTIIGIQDADFEYSINDIPAVIAPILNNNADVVFGSRYKNSLLVHRTFHYLGNKILTVLSNLCSGLYLSDMETCYKFFRAEIIQNIRLESNRFGFEPEVTAKVARLKLRLAEVPINYFPRNYIEGKKITWKDGIAAFLHIFNFNFLKSWDQCFESELPKKYIPKGQHWL
ncbi:MAG TPA: glycosyltransferase family 2 protein [Oligoflexia bacterium]|nr:glycosyltransferase family 2 protein [Oligoflexia bacterium]HMP49045.1 glycosyltransferase family 2 protein [Oligoflexia bacterium]